MIENPPQSFSAEEASLEDLASALSSFERRRRNLIPILQMIQRQHGYLAVAAMRHGVRLSPHVAQ